MAFKFTNIARADLVLAWRISGLSQAAFARQHGIHFTTLNGWIHNPKLSALSVPSAPVSAVLPTPPAPASPSAPSPQSAQTHAVVMPIRVLAPTAAPAPTPVKTTIPAKSPATAIPVPAAPVMHLHISTSTQLTLTLTLPPPAQCCPKWLSELLKGLV